MRSQATADGGRDALTVDEWRRVRRTLRLTPREAEIVELIFDDQCDQGIAAALGISPHTVNTHVKRLFHKLDVTSRLQLVIAVFAACRANGRSA